MSTYRLEKLLAPLSVAVVGASPREGSLGGVVLRCLQNGGYKGALHAVNPKHRTVYGTPCVASLRDLPAPVDLVVVAAPLAAVGSVIDDATARGCQIAIILTAGLGRGPGSIAERVRLKARTTGLRLVGPNCLGVMSPRVALNAGFAARAPKPGAVALISQSGAIAAGLAEWAIERDIGFSGIVSLGDALDVDFGDCLDLFAEDSATEVIILYVEAIIDARKFLSAARKAARIKPVIVLKAGRNELGAKAAATHTGALAGSDAVYDAAFRRAGALRVADLDELFVTIEALAARSALNGGRIAILTNGGGLGVLAVDQIEAAGGQLAVLSPATLAKLELLLPGTWSRANPVDIIGDAPASRYRGALQALLADDTNDAVLVMNCPTALTSAGAAAKTVVDVVNENKGANTATRPVIGVWMGADADVTRRFRESGIASFGSERAAVTALSHLVRLRAGREALSRSPPATDRHAAPDRDKAKSVIDAALSDARRWLNPFEASELLDAYGIMATPVRLATDESSAANLAGEFLKDGGSCVVKILSRDISHKSDVDGVRLGLTTSEAAAVAAREIMARARSIRPDARIDGVTIQPMILKPHARELIIGVAVDATFGPVILFGHGGTAVEVINDKALALLPLDLDQARELIAGTRVSRLLAGYRNIPAADAGKVMDMLVKVSRLVEDNPEIVGLDLNPVLANDEGAVALDARIEIAALPRGDRMLLAGRRFAIRPYPRQLEGVARLPDGSELVIRPLKPTDADAIAVMLRQCSPDDLRMRFFSAKNSINTAQVARLTQLDYAREMALVAIEPASGDILAVVRLHGDANHETAEYAIIVRSDRQGLKLGQDLMTRMIAFARNEDYASIVGYVMSQNERMLKMCRYLGFSVHLRRAGDSAVKVELALKPPRS